MKAPVPIDGAAAGTWQAAGIQLFDRVLALVNADPTEHEAFAVVGGRLARHLRRLLSHVPRVVLDLDGGIPRVNGRALWLDEVHVEAIPTLLRWLAPTRSAGLIFTGEPSMEALERLHMIIGRLRSSGKIAPDHRSVEAILAKAEVFTIHLLAQGGMEHAIAHGDRTLWHYARSVAAMESALLPGKVPYDSVRDLASGLAAAAVLDPALLLAFPMMGGTESVGRRATDIAVLCSVWAVALGEPHEKVTEWAMTGLLHEVGRAWPTEEKGWAAGARICTLGAQQLCDEHRVDGALGVRVIAAIEHGLLLSRDPFIEIRGEPHPASRLVAAARAFLRGIRKGLSALEVGSRLHGRGPRGVDPGLMAGLVAMVGPYPIGTLVELNNEDIGVVFDQVWSARAEDGLRYPTVTVIERVSDHADRAIADEPKQIQLGDAGPDGVPWSVTRTLKVSSARGLVAGVIRTRTKASAAHLGLR
jgi:hypothetical protein